MSQSTVTLLHLPRTFSLSYDFTCSAHAEDCPGTHALCGLQFLNEAVIVGYPYSLIHRVCWSAEPFGSWGLTSAPSGYEIHCKRSIVGRHCNFIHELLTFSRSLSISGYV